MAKNKLTPGEVEHDEVAATVHEVVAFFQNHYLKIILLVLVILIGILVRVSLENRRVRIATEINLAVIQAIAQINEIGTTTDPKQRADAVKRVVENLDDLIAHYPHEALSRQALYLKGRAFYEADQFEPAQTAYQQYIDRASSEEDAARGDVALGYAYENQSFLVGEQKRQRDLLTAALNAYERAARRVPGSYVYFYALMGQARVNELSDQKEKAIALYQRVVDERPVPSATGAAAGADAKEKKAANDVMVLIRRQLDRMESQLSFQKTAQLRLASLKGGAEQPSTPKPKPAVATP